MCAIWFSLIYTNIYVLFFFFSALASILRAWLDQCPEDFQEPPSYPSLHRVLGFLQKAMPGSEPMRRAQSLLEQLRVQASLENETEGKSYPDTVNNFIHQTLYLFFYSCLFCLPLHTKTPAVHLLQEAFSTPTPSVLGKMRSWRLICRRTSSPSRLTL